MVIDSFFGVPAPIARMSFSCYVGMNRMVSESDSPLERLEGRGPRWRARIVILVVVLVGATSASTVWHGAHGTDQGCVVCQL